MKRLLLLLVLLMGCGGGDDVLNPVPQEEPTPVEWVQEEEEEVHVATKEPSDEPLDRDEQDCNEMYAMIEFLVLDCNDGIGLVAEGPGCLKTLRFMTEEEYEEHCEPE